MRFWAAKEEGIWSTRLPYNIYGGLEPHYDPLTDSIYVGDGWGTPYAAIRLRRLSATTGEETASVRLGNVARCLTFLDDEKTILVALDNKLIGLDRATLAVTEKWTSRVPRYASSLVAIGRTAVLMSWLGPNLNTYDLDGGPASRKTVGPCTALFRTSEGHVLVCNGKEGKIFEFDPANKTLTLLFGAPRFIEACYGSAPQVITSSSDQVIIQRHLAISEGDPFTRTEKSITSHRDSRAVSVCQVEAGSWTRVSVPFYFRELAMSNDGRRMAIANGNAVATYRIDSGRAAGTREINLPSKFDQVKVFLDRSLAVGVNHGDQSRITAFRLAD